MKKYYNKKKRQGPTYKVGEWVHIPRQGRTIRQNEKLDHLYEGPYKILEVLGKDVYKLETPGHIYPTFYALLLRK